MALALIFYGSLAALAFWMTCRDPDLLWVGGWLLLGWMISNVLHAYCNVSSLPGPYSLIEFMILFATSIAWDSHRSCWPLLLIGAVNIISICANIAFAAFYPPDPRQVFAWEMTTNVCFVIECLLAGGVGFYDGCRTCRFRRVPALWRRALAAYDSRSKKPSR